MNADAGFRVRDGRAVGSSAISYNVAISAAGEGRFIARCREVPIQILSANAEHDICHLLTKAGYRDGAVQFWRGMTRSLSHSSIHALGCHRIALGDQFPQRVKRKDSRPLISTESVAGLSLETHRDEGGYQPTSPEAAALPERGVGEAA